MTIDLSKLSLPFPMEDIEWRVSRSGMGGKGIFCLALAYITARAIQKRLDDVCGPENWRVEEPRMLDVNGKAAFAVGISIRIETQPGMGHGAESEWITKWDVCEPTNIEAAKGGFSGAMKRAGAQWGIGRYLYYLDETFAEVAESQPAGKQWKWAKLPEKAGGAAYWWKPPSLPAWAIPKEPEHEISETELNQLKRDWRDKFAPGNDNPGELREGFTRFVTSVVGEFPLSDFTCWTKAALVKVSRRIEETTEPNGVSADVPFEE